MTIWRKENPVPTALPAARLFLEDIQEIVNIFLVLLADPNLQPQSADDNPKVQFRIGKEFCDQIEDLRKIAQRTTNFGIKLSREKFAYPYIDFEVNENSTNWTSNGFPTDSVWTAYRKLEALFAKRRLRWANLISSYRLAVFTIQGIAAGILFFTLPSLLFLHQRGLKDTLAGVAAFVLVFVTYLVLRKGLSNHSVVILRNSWDHVERRDELRRKMITGLVPAFFGAIVGVIGTILVTYLQHKYWH